jgi:type III pantothenate kinase
MNQTMQLLIDVGNSSIGLASYANGQLSEVLHGTHSELKELIHALPQSSFRRAVVSSVVPSFNAILVALIDCPVLFVDAHCIPELTLNLSSPEQVGADRLVCSLAAWRQLRKPCLIVDSGTAITFCVVGAKGTYLGGSIFPGMGIASKALNDYTAKIPIIRVAPQSGVIGGDTKTAVEMGLYHGYISMINGMIMRYKQEMGPELLVLGTGAGLEVLSDSLTIDLLEPNLIFKGLAYCADVIG